MSATNGEAPVKIPAGKITFETEAGEKFAVPVISFAKELRELATKMQEEGANHYTYLQQICAIVKERFGAEMSPDEADWFKDQLEIEFAKKKQRQADALKDTLNSLYSMASTAST
jgi:hypothetical protein